MPLVHFQGRLVRVRVRDDGPGLPPAVRDSLFQPVTSPKGQGHEGLGLAISAQIVRRLGGRLECRSDLSGTEFDIYLPQAG